jgi:hypothetical protein
MPLRVNCPGCGVAYSLPDGLAGKNVRCQRCQCVFLAPTAPPPEEPLDVLPGDEPASPAEGLQSRPGRVPPARPSLAAGPPPRPRKGPEAAARRGPSPVVWIVGGVAAVALLVVVLGAGLVAAWFLWPSAGNHPQPQAVVRPRPAEGQGMKPVPAPAGEPAVPAGAGVPLPGGGFGPPGGGVVLPGGEMRPPGPAVAPPMGVPNGGPAGAPQAQPPAVARVNLPPLPDPIEIKPAPVTKETSYKLPEPVASLRVGGGGRFLILHFPNVRKFGLFDTVEAKIVRYVSAPGDDVLYAGGMTALVVFETGSKEIVRYNLLTGERERAGKLDLPAGKVEAFCMGHASAGPLLVGVAGQGAGLYDIDTFKEILLPPDPQNFGFGGGPAPPRRLEGGLYWAGATGRVLGHTGNYGMPNGVRTVVFEGGQVQQYGEHQGTWFVVPGPDDQHVYAAGHGVVSVRVKPVPDVPFSMGPNSGYASHLYLPAAHGPYYLHAQTIGDIGGREEVPQGTVRVFRLGDERPIATYANTAACKYGWEGLRGLGVENSLHLIPKANLLVIVPESRDELRLYPADLEAALEKSGRDYLLFSSSPPGTFRKGQVFTYQAEARAKKKPVTFKLESAPKGMTVDGAGLVRWPVPANFAEDRADVILAAKDAAGQEVFQTFALTGAAAK